MSKSIVVEDEADDGEARHGNDYQTFDDAADQAGVDDLEVLQGALLHDTVEDTDTTLQVAQIDATFHRCRWWRGFQNDQQIPPQEIEDNFGRAVRDIVDQVLP